MLERFDPSDLDALVLGRRCSQFEPDLIEHDQELRRLMSGARVLVVGGGGTIGSATVTLLDVLNPAALHVIDQNENYLAELVRDLRSHPSGLRVREFRALPLDYGSSVMERFLADAKPYDFVLNFAALKHVRSEKDVYSLLQMLDTNVVRHVRFRRWLAQHGHGRRYFSVSTDKAANPTSLMGASKRLMEDVVFDSSFGHEIATSARFANVAFSNGSLLQSFLIRMAKRQPLAAPRSTRRYFVSQQESGQICLLSALLGRDGNILFPRLDPKSQLQQLEDVATRVLGHLGYQAELFVDEGAAREAVESLASKKRWPLLLTPLDTSGEKPYEEFVGMNETETASGLLSLGAISHVPSDLIRGGLLGLLEDAVTHSDQPIDKRKIVNAIQSIVPNFSHRETGKSLDERV